MERESEEHWPPGLKPLLEALSWAVFENTPENILQFASDYCCKLLHFRAENPSLDLDTLIQEFSRSECVKFSTKSNTSSAEDSINDTISSSTARLPSVDLVKEHGFERTWSATGFSFTSGLIDPESTHSTAVFQRKTDQETAGLLGTTSEEGHQVPSALFERVSLHEISSGVDAVLIKTSRLPSESVIMAQTEEIPEVIVFQTAKNKAKDAKSQTLPPFQQLYTAHHFSQHPAGASTGPPVNTRPANTFQERVDFPNYNHRPVGPAPTTVYPSANLASSGNHSQECHLTHTDPLVQLTVSCPYCQDPVTHYCLSLKVYHPLLLHQHSSLPVSSHQNASNQRDTSVCPQCNQQPAPDEAEKRNM